MTTPAQLSQDVTADQADQDLRGGHRVAASLPLPQHLADIAAGDVPDHITAILATAPPLTAEGIERIRALLRPAGRAGARAVTAPVAS